jgi:secreted PhoX family phosphatase
VHAVAAAAGGPSADRLGGPEQKRPNWCEVIGCKGNVYAALVEAERREASVIKAAWRDPQYQRFMR